MAGQIQRMPLMDSSLTQSSAAIDRAGSLDRRPDFRPGLQPDRAANPRAFPKFSADAFLAESAPKTSWELSEWLDVSWFYPDGFEKQQRIETSAQTIIVGKSVVYAFLKPQSPSDEPADRFARACHEIADHQYLAPTIYLGIRLLRWVDGEPQWLAEIPSASLGSAELPAEADEVVLVMRNVATPTLVSSLIANDAELPVDAFDQIIQRLQRFYRRQIRNRSAAGRDPAATMASIRVRLANIEEFVGTYASLLDSISASSLRHCLGYVTTFLKLHGNDVVQRQKLGMIVDSHGNLTARNILTASPTGSVRGAEGDSAHEISLLNRAPRENRRRDVLSDLADLAIDLEIYGAGYLARAVEARLFAALPQAFDAQWYRFYCVLAALTQVTELFEREDATDHEALSRALAAAARHSFGLGKPFGVLVVDPAARADARPERDDRNLDVQYLIECLAELGGMSHLNRMVQLPDLPGYLPLHDTVFERLLVKAQAELEEERPIVLRWPCTEEQIFTLRELFERLNLPWVVVRLDSSNGFADAPAPEQAKPTSVALEPMLPQPDLALYVLSELAKIARKRAGKAKVPAFA